MLTSMQHIKEVIVNQQKALQEQRSRVAHDEGYGKIDGVDGGEYGDDGGDGEKDGGFAGGDAKKKKGVCLGTNGECQDGLTSHKQRAAPPGRCHSCNRAETPEWRRGPDGARTLCNACGLRKFIPHPLRTG